jgi:uncharacterized protein (UPF0332 family)
MSLLEKSDENKRTAQKCKETKAYNAGISRAYYATFQRVEYVLKSDPDFDYEDFLRTTIKTDKDHIPHGNMQLAMTKYLLAKKKGINLGKVIIYDNLYYRRRKADYSDHMFKESDLIHSLSDMETILGLIA